MIHEKLREFYIARGLTADDFWIGSEHPALEDVALELLKPMASKSVLEIGYQAGGFAVPLIIENLHDPAFRYLGIDNLQYRNALSGGLIREFLLRHGANEDKFLFLQDDATGFLMRCTDRFDLILVDHVKRLYPEALRVILSRSLIARGGCILLHDVENKASEAWYSCVRICRAFGYQYELLPDVPEGLALLRPGADTGHARIRTGLYQAAVRVGLAARRLLKP